MNFREILTSARRRHWAQSILLHSLALFLALGLSRHRSEPEKRVRWESRRIEITVEGGASPSFSAKRRGKPSTRTRAPREPSRPDLRNYGVAIAKRPRVGSESGSQGGGDASRGSSGATSGGRGGGDGFEVARGMDLRKEGELYPFLEALWRKVDAATIYPEEFVKGRRAGTVDVQLIVGRDGVFTGEILSAESADPLLKTYVLATLLLALRDPLPSSLRADREEMILSVRFEFKVLIRGGGEVDYRDNPHRFKNVMYVRRNATVDPKINQAVQEFFASYLPPIIPVPGGVVIDFIGAYRFFANLGKPSAAEIRQRRLELQSEKWSGILRKAPGARTGSR